MRAVLFCVYLFFALILYPQAYAGGEHPKGEEHPQTTEEGEHPEGEEHTEGREHPKQPSSEHPKKKGATTEEPQSFNKSAVEATVTTYVNSQTGRTITVQDTQTQTSRALNLTRIHNDKISRLGPKTAFVCADFTDRNGETVDLDFFLTNNNGTYEINKIDIHKVQGKERYTYVEQKGVWQQVPVTKR